MRPRGDSGPRRDRPAKRTRDRTRNQGDFGPRHLLRAGPGPVLGPGSRPMLRVIAGHRAHPRARSARWPGAGFPSRSRATPVPLANCPVKSPWVTVRSRGSAAPQGSGEWRVAGDRGFTGLGLGRVVDRLRRRRVSRRVRVWSGLNRRGLALLPWIRAEPADVGQDLVQAVTGDVLHGVVADAVVLAVVEDARRYWCGATGPPSGLRYGTAGGSRGWRGTVGA